MWEINVAEQTVNFFISLALGGTFCIVYDLFKSVRTAFEFKSFGVFIFDVLFFIICAFVTFCFLLSLTQGMIRGYFIFGIVVGFLVVFFSVSKFISTFLTAALRLFITVKKQIKNFISRKIAKFKKKIKIKGKKH